MSHKPCENFKCRYEHQKLIERVRELEKEKKYVCEKCELTKELDSLVKEKCNHIRDLDTKLKGLSNENEIIYGRLEEFYYSDAKLRKSNRRLRAALLSVSLASIAAIYALCVLVVLGG